MENGNQQEEEENQNKEQIQEEKNKKNLDINPERKEVIEDYNNQSITQKEHTNENKMDNKNENEMLERIETIDQDIPIQYQSQKFKVETYEPVEQKNENEIENESLNHINERIIEDNNVNNKNLELIEKINTNEMGPRDSVRQNIRTQIIPKENNNINVTTNVNINVKLNESGPKDSSGKKKKKLNIKHQINSSYQKDNINKNIGPTERINTKDTGPRDSKRRNIQNFNTNENKLKYNSKNENQNIQKRKMPLNANELKELNKQQQFKFVKKDLMPMDSSQKKQIQNKAYNYQQQNYNQRYSPKYNEMNNEALNNNFLNLENFENSSKQFTSENQSDRKAVTLGPYLNYVEEINNVYSSGPIIIHKDNREKIPYNYAESNQQSSQKEFDITMSDRDNPLIISDEKGNMNYLEKQYFAYQNKMNKNEFN